MHEICCRDVDEASCRERNQELSRALPIYCGEWLRSESNDAMFKGLPSVRA